MFFLPFCQAKVQKETMWCADVHVIITNHFMQFFPAIARGILEQK
jgi:hypothetical protein